MGPPAAAQGARRQPGQADGAEGRPGGSSDRPHVGEWLLAAALVVGLCAHAATHGSWIVDDAAVSFSYARNLAEGHGLTVNPGADEPPIEGYSNPLWVLLCALFIKVRLFHPVLFPKIAGVAFTLGACWLAAALVSRLCRRRERWLRLLAPALLVANGSVVVWGVSGLENAEYLFCILLALQLYLGDLENPTRFPRAGFVLAAVALSRPEGVMYVLVILGEALVRGIANRRWRWLIGLFAPVVVLLGAYALWHLRYFGAILPNTFYAKSRSEPLLSSLVDLSRPSWRHLLGAIAAWRLHWLVLVAALALAARGAVRRGLLVVLGALGASLFFVVAVPPDWMMQYRFLHPTFALLAVLGCVGLVGLRDRLASRVGIWGRRSVGAVALLGWLLVASALPGQHAEMRRPPNPTMPFSRALEFVDWMLASVARMGEPRPVLAVSNLGAAAWRNEGQVRLIDLGGLADPFLARALHEGRDSGDVCRYLFVQNRPVLVQVWPYVLRRWPLQGCEPFRTGYARFDRVDRSEDLAGIFIRRDLIEEPRPPELLRPDPAATERDGVSVLRVEHGAAIGARLPVRIWFSLARPPAGRRPLARLVLDGTSGGPRPLVVPLLPALPLAAMETRKTYRHSGFVALRPGERGPYSLQGSGPSSPTPR